MWPFDEELAPTVSEPIKAPEQQYTMPVPVMHAEAEREREGGNQGPHYPAVTGDQSGPVAPEDVKAAVGHYADYGPVDLSRSNYVEMDADQKKTNGAFRVQEGYGADPNKKELDPLAPIDLSSTEDRLKFLNGFTQGGADDPNSKNMCGPTTLIGAAVLANGANGVGTLLDAVDKLEPNGKEDALMKQLRAKLDPANPQPLTGADLQNAQNYIYERLNKHEGLDVHNAEAVANSSEGGRGVDTSTMQKLIHGSDELNSMFKNNNMQITAIDTGGANGTIEDHAVLQVNDADGKPVMIYDPGQRKNGQVTGRIEGWDGKQSTDLSNGIADYHHARRSNINPN